MKRAGYVVVFACVLSDATYVAVRSFLSGFHFRAYLKIAVLYNRIHFMVFVDVHGLTCNTNGHNDTEFCTRDFVLYFNVSKSSSVDLSISQQD